MDYSGNYIGQFIILAITYVFLDFRNRDDLENFKQKYKEYLI